MMPMDLETGPSPRANPGAFVMHWQNRTLRQRRLLNREQLNNHCIPFATLAHAPLPDKPTYKRFSIIFQHIPRTGGTTLEHLLAKNYQPSEVSHVNGPDFVRCPEQILRNNKPNRILMGHYQQTDPIYQFPKGNIVHITILRDPVQRFLSYYRYLIQRSAHKKHHLAAGLSLPEFLERAGDFPEAFDGMSRRLSGLGKNTDPDQLAEQAIAQLQNRFSIFGLTEQYGTFVLQCLKLGIFRDGLYRPHNATQSVMPPDESVISQIRKANPADVRLYQWAQDCFKQRSAQLQINESVLQTFENHQSQFQQMLEQWTIP